MALSFKKSKFTLLFPFSKDYYLAFSTLTKAMLVVDKETKKFIETQNSSGMNNRDIQLLEKNGIIVNNKIDEDILLKYWFNKFKFSNKKLGLMIINTYSCNLKCPYCFQKNVKSNIHMSEETCKKIINFVKERVTTKDIRAIDVGFQGGEPIINIKSIYYLSRNLKKIADEKDVNIKSTLITNGTLLKKEIIIHLLKNGLAKVQVTLDGPPYMHNKRRIFKNGRGTCSIILDNLIEIVDLVKTTIRINYDKQNVNTLPELFDILDQYGLKNKIILDIAPVIERKCDYKYSIISNDVENMNYLLNLSEEAASRGFKLGDRRIQAYLCLSMMENSVVIDPLGNMYKCSGLCGKKTMCIGNIEESKVSYKNMDFVSMDLWEDCGECPYIPMCSGGCRFKAYTEYGEYRKKRCEKTFFENVLGGLLKIYVNQNKTINSDIN